jgi:RNA-splicing ligase RtcB
LGGGNHFISVEWCEETNEVYLLIHCGSRHLGVEVCKYWQTKAIQNRSAKKGEVKELINKLKAEGREKEIQSELKKIKRPAISNEMAYLDLNIEPDDFRGYLHDMVICQEFARLNHETIAYIIGKYMGIKFDEHIYTTHNYIDSEQMMLRKGAVSAYYGETLIIPMNMRDGSLICVGKGNVDWNYSAPHGAGRVMGRKEARYKLQLEDFEKSMEGIWSSTVCKDTLDEAPMAYKDMSEIVANIEPTAEVVNIIKPIFNFKAAE